MYNPVCRPLALAIFLLFCSACSPPAPAPKKAAAENVPPPLKIIQPQWASVGRSIVQPGAVQAFEEARLVARVPGYVKLVCVDIGQKVAGSKFDSSGKLVEPGDCLAEIAVPELEEEANQKKALVVQAEAEIDQSVKALASAEAQIATMEASVLEAKAVSDRWESEYNRMVKLVANGTIDAQARDETQNQYKAAAARMLSAKAAVTKAVADRDKSQADVRAAQARLAVAQAEARRLQALVGYARITAPFDGIVTVRRVNTGDFVHPGNSNSDCLFTVARLDPVRIVISVPEADAALVQEKSKVQLTIQAAQAATVDASITRISWALDPSARTLRAEVDLPNKDGTLRPGMYVYAKITSEYPKCWTLPTAAVVKQGDAMVCFMVENGKAIRTPIKLGRSDGKTVEVLHWQQAGTPATWNAFTGKENLVDRAQGVTDGQTIS